MDRVSSYAAAFAPDVLTGAQFYLKARNYDIIEDGVNCFFMDVAGQDVCLEYASGEIVATCTCDEGRIGEPCVHLWVALNVAERSPRCRRWFHGKALPNIRIEVDRESGFADVGGSLSTMLDRRAPTPQARLVYIIRESELKAEEPFFIERMVQRTTADGDWSNVLMQSTCVSDVEELGDPYDVQLLKLFDEASPSAFGISSSSTDIAPRFSSSSPLAVKVIDRLVLTERFFLERTHGGKLKELSYSHWDEPAQIHISIKKKSKRSPKLRMRCEFVGGSRATKLSKVRTVLPQGLFLQKDRFKRYEPASEAMFGLICCCRDGVVSGERFQELAATLSPEGLACLEVDTSVGFKTIEVAPEPLLQISEHGVWTPQQRMKIELKFNYGSAVASYDDKNTTIPAPAEGHFYHRDLTKERQFVERLRRFEAVRPDSFGGGYIVATPELMNLVREFADEGWEIESVGMPVRTADFTSFRVRSNIDWFDLEGEIHFGDQRLTVADALDRISQGQNMLQLGDGSLAVLPEVWLNAQNLLLRAAQKKDAGFRFAKNQIGLVDALLENQPEVDLDAKFKKMQASLLDFNSLKEKKAPRGFKGELREYQREGLAWLVYLQQFGFGGCLADDMGLGKTIQVLALLEEIRQKKGAKRPHLLVVPRSLIFNWQEESKRFTPKLTFQVYHGADRDLDDKGLAKGDIVLTTYATMRNDVVRLKEIEFDYCILDEAQAIKNAEAKVSKSVRLINARNRLALTGTPIENHLGELWSIFEFLNPGMLGKSRRLRDMMAGKQMEVNAEAKMLLSRALRPFMLRRTKEQVVDDLPEKLEQTLYCDLDGDHMKHYRSLREYYRARLLGLIDDKGLKKAKIDVLEALLRLRQCACHPRLVDDRLKKVRSAKMDLLMEYLDEILDEGHKALVFSQFTSLLSIVREEFDASGVTYEYLDGRTRKRQERVDRFQNDPDCKVFLISLKAGGVGLNLTAADYVFILDPWWNPAVEAQAIDRTHRIGQTKPVFAYRIIGRNTVEEKVLQLQEKKRELADAILNVGASVLQKMSTDDLELLLS